MRDQQYLAWTVTIMVVFFGCLFDTITANENYSFQNTSTAFEKLEIFNVNNSTDFATKKFSDNNKKAFDPKQLNGNNNTVFDSDKLNGNNNSTLFDSEKLKNNNNNTAFATAGNFNDNNNTVFDSDHNNNIREPFYGIRNNWKKNKNNGNAEMIKLVKLKKCLTAQDVRGMSYSAVLEIIKKCNEEYYSKSFNNTVEFENNKASEKPETWNASNALQKPKILRFDCMAGMASVVAKLMTLTPGAESNRQVCAEFRKLKKSCSVMGSDPVAYEQIYRQSCKAMGIFNCNKFFIIMLVLLATFMG